MQKMLVSFILPICLLGCASPQGGDASRNGVTTGQGSRVETGLDMNIGPDAIQSSPSVRERSGEAPTLRQPFVNDPATQDPIRPAAPR